MLTSQPIDFYSREGVYLYLGHLGPTDLKQTYSDHEGEGGGHLGPTDLKQTYSDHAWYVGGTWDPQI